MFMPAPWSTRIFMIGPSALAEYPGGLRRQRRGVVRLAAEADVAVGTDHIETGTAGTVAMMQLALGIQEDFAFAGQVPSEIDGQLVRDDEMRLDTAGMGAPGGLRQGLQPLMRFRRRVRPGEQQHVVRRSAQSLEQANGFTSGMKHEPSVDGAVAGARPCAEIMPSQDAGVRPVGSRQKLVVLGDDGAVAVADVQ